MSGHYSYLIYLLFTTRAKSMRVKAPRLNNSFRSVTESNRGTKQPQGGGQPLQVFKIKNCFTRFILHKAKFRPFCDLARWFTSTFGHSYMNDMIRVRVSMIVILQRKVRELRIMIRKRTQWLVHWDKCMYCPQSIHALIYFWKCRKSPAQLAVC